jgi:tight adherence protein B
MATWMILFLGGALTIGTMLLIDAVIRFRRVARGEEGSTVDRRLSQVAGESDAALRVEDDGIETGADILSLVAARLQRLIDQSGTTLSGSMLTIAALVVSLAVGFVLAAMLPAAGWYVWCGVGLTCGIGGVLMYLAGLRNARITKFEAQLPDTIDLIVRSLRVGHPLSACLAVIAKELASPIRDEFQLAHYKVSYGYTVSAAFREMAERVPLPDLKFLVAVLQLQEESGGNPVETLSKLAAVIRERFHMFQKIRSITAEGRVSAWLLSVIPFVAAFFAVVVKPDYYQKVEQLDDFPVIAAIIGVALVLNVVVMRAITRIKV